HTRWPRDWSSDVCSSDLGIARGTRRDWYMSMPSRKALRAGTPVPSTKDQSRTARNERWMVSRVAESPPIAPVWRRVTIANTQTRSEEHTSELQSRGHLVC